MIELDIGSSFISAINTIVDNKKQSFDRTIQAIVKDNSDPDKVGEIKIAYKDAILPVYTDVKEVKNYPKGSHIYVTIPNNDMSARKTILGLVEKIGPLTVMGSLDTYSLESRYIADDSLTFDDSFFNNLQEYEKGWTYKRNAEEWTIYNKVTGEQITDSDALDILTPFFKMIKTFAISSDTIKFSSDVIALLLPQQRNLLKADYGIGLDFYLKKIEEEDFAFNDIEEARTSLAPIKARLNIDQMTGNPYLQSNQTQYIIIDTSRLNSEYKLDKINFFYYRRGFPLVNDNSDIGIKMSNFTIEAITQVQNQETSDLALYITTPKGKMFLPKGNANQKNQGAATDVLTLNAVVKEDGIQLDNTNLICYWYERDLSYIDFDTNIENKDILPEGSNTIYDMAGAGWRLSSVDDDGIPYSINPLTITRDDLYGLVDKEYKVVGSYQGTLLSATAVIKNLDNKNVFSLNMQTETKNNKKIYTYTLLKSQDESNIETDIRWYYAPDSGSPRLLRTIETDEEGRKYQGFSSAGRNSISLEEGAFKYSGQIICEVYRYVHKTKRLYTILTEIYNANTTSDVLFHNFEQVFLYDVNGKLTLIDNDETENKYSVAYKPVGLSGDVTNVEWRVPTDYFEKPNNVAEIDKINRFYVIKNILSLSNLKPKSSYPSFKNFDNCPLQENIVVDFNYENKRYRKTTNFSFVKEGMDGTNGSGIYCRIVPNIDRDNLLEEYNPNTVILSVVPQRKNSTTDLIAKAMFNFLPFGLSKTEAEQMMKNGGNSKIQFFKIQLWRKNQKIFEDYKIQNNTSNVQNIEWELFPETQSSFMILDGTCHIVATKVFSTQDQYTEFKKWLQSPQGISAKVKYQNMLFKFSLPFLVVGSTPDGISINFNDICRWRFFNKYDSFSLSSYSKFYYNEDGLQDTSLSLAETSLGFMHYKDYPLMYSVQPGNNQTIVIEQNPKLFKLFNQNETLINFDVKIINDDVNKREILVYANQYFSDTESKNVLLYKLDGNNFYYQIPLRQILNLVNDSYITDWNGKAAIIDEDRGTITAQYIAAGKKHADNTFSGVIAGAKDNKVGLLLYSEGNKSMYLNSEGKIELGQNPAQKIIEDGQSRLISNGLNEGLSIDLKTGILKYNYAGAVVSSESENELINTNIAIQISRKNENSFLLTENGILQTKELVGKDGRNGAWGIYEAGKLKKKDNDKLFFLDENGIAGIKELYIDTVGGRDNETVSGLVLQKKSIKCNLNGFCQNRTAISNVLRLTGENFGFALDEKGICIGASENGYAALLSSGYCFASAGFIPASDITKTNSEQGVWKFNASGIEGPNSTLVINQRGITSGFLHTSNIITNNITVEDNVHTSEISTSGEIIANGRIHTNSDLQGNTIYSANQIQANSFFCVTDGDGYAKGETDDVTVGSVVLHFKGGIFLGATS